MSAQVAPLAITRLGTPDTKEHLTSLTSSPNVASHATTPHENKHDGLSTLLKATELSESLVEESQQLRINCTAQSAKLIVTKYQKRD